jgi:hypothetical protein
MNSRDAFFVAAIACVAALSFAAGRMATAPSGLFVAAKPTESSTDRDVNQASLAPSIPLHLPDVVKMPFRETYAVFKAASDETLRSYFTELQQKRPKPTRHATLVSFFKTLIHVNPSLTAELISRLKKDDRWPAMFAIRDASPPRGMQAVAEVLLSFDRMEISSCSWDMLRETLDEWGRNDPLALKEFLETHRDRDVDRYFPKLVRNWAAYDPEAAQEWMIAQVQQHPPPPEGDENLGNGWTSTVGEMAISWIEGFLENDPDAAVNYILEHAADPSVRAAMDSVAGDLFAISPGRTRDFLNRLPLEQRLAALEGVARKADGFVRSDARDKTTSPRFVAEWMLKSFPENWQGSFGNVLREWKFGDAQELFSWMADLPAITREAVVRRFPTYVSDDKPNEDFDLIMQARDSVVRDGLLEVLARGATYNGQALRRILEKADLPASQKVYLASLIPSEKTETASENADEN